MLYGAHQGYTPLIIFRAVYPAGMTHLTARYRFKRGHAINGNQKTIRAVYNPRIQSL